MLKIFLLNKRKCLLIWLAYLKANEDIQLEFNKNGRRLIRQKREEKVHFNNSRSFVLLSLANMLYIVLSYYVI